MFNKKWFDKHQKILLWLLNTPIINRWFKYILRIHNDFPKGKKAIKITPSSYHWHIENNKYGFDCRTHDKFAKRIYFAFYWIWWLCHQWDKLIAQKYIRVLNLGFDAFGPYRSNEGSGGPSVDGSVWRGTLLSETWSEIRAGAGTNTNTSSTLHKPGPVSVATSNLWSELFRTIYTIDISEISETIQTVNFHLYVYDKVNTLGWSNEEAGLIIVKANPNAYNSLTPSDYGQLTDNITENKPYNELTNGTYHIFTFLSGGVTYTEQARTGSGILELGSLLYADYTGVTPPWQPNNRTIVYHFSADRTGITQDPKLTGTYTIVVNSTPRGDNSYWLYKNKLENVSKIIGHNGTVNTDYGTANLFDNDLTTHYKTNQSGSDGDSIFFDFGSAIHVNNAVVIHNLISSGYIHLRGGSGTAVLNFTGTLWSVGTIQPDKLGTVAGLFTNSYGYRYWRLDFKGNTRSIDGSDNHTLTELFLGKRLELTESPVYPLIENTENSVTQSELTSGKQYKYFNYARKSWSFNYEAINNANYVALKNMADFLKGSYKPFFFYLEPPESLDYKYSEINFMRMINNSFTYEEVIKNIWNTQFSIDEEI